MRALALLALLVAAPALALPPQPFSAGYVVQKDGSAIGAATLDFKRDRAGGEFVTRSRGTDGLAALAALDIEERSTLRWTGDGIETVSYRYRQTSAFNQRERRIDVSRSGIVSQDKQRHEFPYRPGVLDRHALTIALMQALASGARGELSFWVVDRDELEQQRYRIAGEERLNTAIGARPAIRVERLREGDGRRSTTIWFDRERSYLPLRILDVNRKGETLDLQIRG